MKVDTNFVCFGCQEKGDVIRFVGKLFSLTPFEAAQKIICDFGLDINAYGAKQKELLKSKQKRVQLKDEELRSIRFQKAVKKAEDVYCSYFRLLNEWRYQLAPASPEEEYNPLFLEALQKTDQIEQILDILQFGSLEDKIKIIIKKWKEVEDLELRVGRYRSDDPVNP